MITKIYELTRMASAHFSTKYCGIVVELPFTTGRGTSEINRAEFVTTNRFVQDAVEHDPRFNHDFRLAQVIKDKEELEKEAKAAEDALKATEPVVEEVVEEEKPKKSRKKKDDGTTQVPEVVTINDAYDYFAAKGIVIDDDEQLEQTMRELNVSFPNLEK